MKMIRVTLMDNKKENKKFYVAFYIGYPYYIPHFLPISNYLKKIGKNIIYILSDNQNPDLMVKILEQENIPFLIGKENLYKNDYEFMFFANIFHEERSINAIKLFLWHGIGTKPYNYEEALKTNDLLFTEGKYKYNTITKKFPFYKNKVKEVGYSKLDDINNSFEKNKEYLVKKYELDKNKKTILYAPTFYPSSIEKMSKTFPADFKGFNIIVKAHYLSFERKRYKKQVELFNKWSKYENCVICNVDEYNLVPFLQVADIMISDESAAVFEFTALNKPVILNRFLKLRWSYIINPKKLMKRLDKGMDKYRLIGDNADNYIDMVNYVYDNIENPNKFEKERLLMTKDICGNIDGNVSKRIHEHMLILNEKLNK